MQFEAWNKSIRFSEKIQHIEIEYIKNKNKIFRKIMPLVATIRTSSTQLEFCRSVIECWREMFEGQTPSKQSVGIIFAQHAIETGNGSFCWNNNISNVKWTKSAGNVDYCALKGVWEIINGKRVELTPSDPGSWFRSFKTLNEGMRFHLDLLKNKRYKTSWVAIEQGSVVNFATLLRDRGYFTASLSSYIAGMNRFYTPYMKGSTYEHALAELDNEAPPLQPWVEVPEYEPIWGELKVNLSMSEQDPVEQGIEDAEQVPQGEIERWGGTILSKIASLLQQLLQWLTQRK